MSPIVIIIHASEDKDKFVDGFIRYLKSNHITCLSVIGEEKIGYFSVDDLFIVGNRIPDAIIIVLSNIILQKPWFEEEMKVCIEKSNIFKTELITSVIDDSEIPESLKSTVCIKFIIQNTNVFQGSDILDKICRAVKILKYDCFPHRISIDQICYDNLSNNNSIIFSEACIISYEKNSYYFQTSNCVQTSELAESIKKYGIQESELNDMLEILDKYKYIVAQKVPDGKIPAFSITNYGLKAFSLAYFDNYENFEDAISEAACEKERISSAEISEQNSIPILLVNTVLRDLSDNGSIIIEDQIISVIVSKVDAKFKRKVL